MTIEKKMPLVSSDNNKSQGKHSVDLSHNYRRIILISLMVVSVLSLTDLIGWAFDLTFLKSISSQWIPMKIITAICFILTTVALYLISSNFPRVITKYYTYLAAGFILLVSALTIFDYFYFASTGNEPVFSNTTLFRFFLPYKMRMAFISAINFFIISWILFLLEGGTRKKADFAHILVIPVLLMGYLIPLSYILGVTTIHLIGNMPMALNTGIAFCAVCIAVLFMKTDSWLMKVFTSGDSGQVLAKKLLPSLMALPLIIGWLRITGERNGVFSSEEGIVFVAATYTGCFLILVWITARSFNVTDNKRKLADNALRKSNEELEQRIRERDERTYELLIAEKEVLKSKEKLDLALDNGNIGIWELEIKTGDFTFDKRFKRMFGMEQESLLMKLYDFENYIHGDDSTYFHRSVVNAIENDVPLETVFRTKPVENRISHINIKAITQKDPDGIPVKMSGVCFDITEMKKGAEKTLLHLNEELVRSNRELEQFAYVASHDLQEPLRMVSSFTQMLARRYKDKLDDNANEFIHFAVEGASRMQSLINDLLEYSRVGTRGKNPELIDMHMILGQAINNLSLKIKEKNALVTNDDLPEIFADGRQMQQLFQNLIDNALKFSNSSPVIHISSGTENGDYLFSVKDNGIGIEPQYFGKIFQIFQRLHAKEDYPGTGIGLAICRRIVERHGGKIWVESKPGEGTKFLFTIIKNK